MRYTGIVKKITFAVGIILLVSGVFQLIFEYTPKEIILEQSNEVGNYGDHAQENYLLLTSENGVWSMPFVFGSKLYIYDIEKDKMYLLWNQKGILQEFSTKMCFNGENVLVFGGRGMGGEPSDTTIIKLNGGKEKIAIDPTSCISLKENVIYYTGRICENDEQFYDVIWEKNIISGEQKKLLQRPEYSIESFKIMNERLFAIDENIGCLVIKNLSTGTVNNHRFSENVYPAYIIPKDENSVIVIGIGEKYQYKVIEYQFEKDKERIITLLGVDNEISSYYGLWDNGKYKNGYLYCNDMSDNIVRINVKTGKTEVLISANQLEVEGNDYCHAEYCQDYIAVEVYHNYAKTLYIFDYEGTFIRKKSLHQ